MQLSKRPISFLEAEARLGGTFLHPGGRPATDRLLAYISPESGDRVLELGSGPGTTTALLLGEFAASVVAIDASTAMLQVARRRLEEAGLSDRARLIRGDLAAPLPLDDGSCDAVLAESVIALLDPEPVLSEVARVLRPGGKLALNERIWRPNLTQQEVSRVNALSRDAFGIPAATPAPLDREGWTAALASAGLEVDQVIPVGDLPGPDEPASVLLARARRYRHYLHQPRLAWRQFQFKRALRRHRRVFDALESYLFFAHKPPR